MSLLRPLYLVLLAALLSLALSCSCAPQSVRDQVCSAGSATVARVVARFDNCPGKCNPINDQFKGRVFYIARVERFLRGVPIDDDVMILRTTVNDGLCGVKLTVGKLYLINVGKPRPDVTFGPKKVYGISLCDGLMPWWSLTPEQRWKSLHAKYTCPAKKE